jgi:penicillin-binding protein 2
MGVSRQSLAVIHHGMTMVANEPHGTAYEARIKDPVMAMAAKTGSAQVRRITQRERDTKIKEDQIPWKDRDNALFVAFAPVSAPRFAIGICIEHGMHGGSAAGPVGRDLLIAAQLRAADPKAPIPGLAPLQPVDGVQPPAQTNPDGSQDPDLLPEGGA